MVKPHSSNFSMITTNILGVRIFRKFTVVKIQDVNGKGALVTISISNSDQSFLTYFLYFDLKLECSVLQ